jgi:hypothetical protein
MGNNLTTITPLPEGLAERLDRRFLDSCMGIKHKFGAVRCDRNGIKFPSQLERACFDYLMTLKDKKKIRMFLRQIPFDIPGPAKHVIDYCIFTSENVIFVEAKGRDLPMGKLKRKQVEELFDIDIHVVKNIGELDEVVQING